MIKRNTFFISALLLSTICTHAQTYFGEAKALAESVASPRSVYACDIDGDGDLDVLSASYDDNKIAWYRNTDGKGNFTAPQVITTDAFETTAVYAEDLDGDGDLDALSVSMASVAWYENTDGDGTFGSKREIPSSILGQSSVFASDLDGDGDNDVLSTGAYDDEVSWYENTDGNGSFSTQKIIAIADGASCVFASDLDEDGDNDVLFSSKNNNTVTWYKNNGSGSFSPATFDISTGVFGASSVYACDFDGDGDNDVLAAGTGSGGRLVWYRNNNGSDLFTQVQSMDVTLHFPNTAHAADVDKDGDLDIFSVSTLDNNISWYRNTDGAGTFSTQQVISNTAYGASSVFAGDFDGDGDADVVSALSTNNNIAWFENTDGNGTFSTQNNLTAIAYGAHSVYSSDIDGDGDMDVLSASTYDDKIAWYENMDGKGNMGNQQIIIDTADGARSVFTSDLDGDGDMDVLSATSTHDEIAWYENLDGNGTFGAQQVISTAVNGAMSVYSCDLDGDGDNDVLSASRDDNKIAWYQNNGAGIFSAQQVITTATYFAFCVSASDIDGDGDLDVLSASYYDNEISWFENTDGNGTFGSQNIITNSAELAASVHACDIDGDGDMDVLSASEYDDKIAWYRNTDGNGTFSSQLTITTTADGAYSVYGADFDSDGDMDVVSASMEDDKVTWYENRYGTGSYFERHDITTTADGASSVIATDLDNDGNMDIVAASFWDNRITWYKNYTLKIVAQPQNSTISCSSNTSFNISAEDAESYSWRVNDGSGFVTIANNAIYSGATTDSLQLAGATSDMTGYQYRCRVYNSDGNLTSEAAVLTISDTASPIITSSHSNQTIDANASCGASLPDYTGSVTATDNCDLSLDVTQSPVAGTTISGTTNAITLVVTDDLGNTVQVAFNVSVTDTTDPVISSTHTDQTVNANASCGASLPDYTGSVVAADNCDASLNITQSPVSGTIISGTINAVTLTVTDDAGNTAEITFNVGVVDNTDPVISSTHANQAVDANTSCGASLPDYTGGVTATDNCDAALDIAQSPVSGTAISGTTNSVILTVTDDAGNTAQVTFNVSVTDNTNPVISSTHTDQTIYANASCQASLPDYTGSVTATDNCDASLDITQSPVSGTVISGTTNSVTLTVTDDAGNTDQVTFSVSVIDNTNPVINSTHTDQTVDASASCEASLPDYTGSIIATDNCDATLDIAQLPVSGTTISGTTNPVTLTVTDDTGNTDQVTFNVSVIDNTNPVISSTHTNQTINTAASCQALLPDYTGSVAATDNCDISLDVTQSPIAGTAISGAINEITLTVTDDAGNSVEAKFNIEVIDNIDPVITSTHADQSVDANASCEASLPDYTGDVVATDNCDASLDITQLPVSGTTISGTTNAVTLTVRDDAGNAVQVTFNAGVVDNAVPVISSTHTDQTIDANANCEASLLDYTGSVTATDNCDAALDIIQSPGVGTTISGSVNEITLTVTDDAGNSSEVKFNVGVVENTAPVITSTHTDQTLVANVNCEASLPAYTETVIASDNCDNELEFTQLPIVGTIVSGKTNTVTLSVADDSGNLVEVTFNVSVKDATIPTIVCVENQEIHLTSGNTIYNVLGTELDPISTNDNCRVASVINNFNNSQTLKGAEFPIGTTSVVWTVKDEADNSAYCNFDVTVNKTSGTREIVGDEISVYPNPTRGKVYFESNKEEIQNVKVFDLAGRLILNKQDLKDKNIDFSHLKSGVYRVSIATNNRICTKTVVKE